MMKRFFHILAIAALLWFPSVLKAQEDVSPMIFEAYECDFGEVEQAGGTLFQTFHFINAEFLQVAVVHPYLTHRILLKAVIQEK